MKQRSLVVCEDRILINDLLVRGTLGVNESERKKKQEVLVNIALCVDLRPAGRSDDVADSVDYETVTKRVIEHVERTTRFTIEALAQDVATLCLSTPGVTDVHVRVEKPGALRFARSVGVEIERRKEGLG